MKPDTPTPCDEARRLWTTLPRSEWAPQLEAMPEWRTLHNVRWPYRESVRQRLWTAIKAARAGVGYLGMNADNRFSTEEKNHE